MQGKIQKGDDSILNQLGEYVIYLEFFEKKLKELHEKQDTFSEKYAGLINPVKKPVRDFSVDRLARILYEHVDTKINPRADLDWQTAVNHIDNRLGDGWISGLARDYVVCNSYEHLRDISSGKLPDMIAPIITDSDESYRAMLGILNGLLVLPEDMLTEIVTKGSQDLDGKKMYDFLGRKIWNRGYQEIKRHLPKEYTSINFA